MKRDDLMTGLPGEELLRRGLADFHSGRRTVPACLVRMARPRLSRAGLLSPAHFAADDDSELQLYRLLQQEQGDAYSRYNALLRELASFEMALDHRIRKLESEKIEINRRRTETHP